MNTPKLARSLATAFAVASVLTALCGAAPSVKGGSGQYAQAGDRWNDDLTDEQQYGIQSLGGELQYDNTGSGDVYLNSGQAGIDGDTQYTANGANYGSNGAYGDSDEVSAWGPNLNALSRWGTEVAQNVARGAREFGSDVADTASELWNTVDDTFDRAWEHFKNGLKSLGDTIQQGASYCAHVLQQKADDVRSSELLQKLDDKVDQGNEQVMEFFQVLGEKITKWAEEHADDSSVDAGFSSDSELYQQGAGRFDQFQREGFPDLFQDNEVQGEIEKLVDYGVIQQEEADLLVQQQRQW